ncbi:MAG: hypothetical protein AAB801_02605, partial [Patescibacteria group bacterium]
MQERPLGYRTTEIFRAFAENKLNRPIPEKVLESWLTLTRVWRLADDLIDNEADETRRLEIYGKGVNYLAGETRELGIDDSLLTAEMAVLKTHLNGLSKNQRSLFLRNLKTILRVTEKIKKTEDPITLARLSMLEGQLTTYLYMSFL